jgi:hypothetical protein
MASITAKQRDKLPASKFGLPNTRQYPIDTPGRAADAKARAAQQLKAGNLSKAQYDQIVERANKVLGESS